MSPFTRKILVIAFVALASFAPSLTAATVPAGEKPDSTTEKTDERFARITDWLLLGPVPVPLPAFHGESKKEFDASWLLGYDHLDL
ncbi:MAG: hypothetical protein KAU49_07295, partial [Candidatus Krumholzibacteria bacterium]|nr:hypothetical protein [Candidatus Krumholzibacteria bacterium]